MLPRYSQNREEAEDAMDKLVETHTNIYFNGMLPAWELMTDAWSCEDADNYTASQRSRIDAVK